MDLFKIPEFFTFMYLSGVFLAFLSAVSFLIVKVNQRLKEKKKNSINKDKK
ncbi:MAG: hypothetical protein ACRDD7_17875 [Peptostreptococcaceae bacterium]